MRSYKFAVEIGEPSRACNILTPAFDAPPASTHRTSRSASDGRARKSRRFAIPRMGTGTPRAANRKSVAKPPVMPGP